MVKVSGSVLAESVPVDPLRDGSLNIPGVAEGKPDYHDTDCVSLPTGQGKYRHKLLSYPLCAQ